MAAINSRIANLFYKKIPPRPARCPTEPSQARDSAATTGADLDLLI
jgi:hypothetical protein